MTGLAWRRQVCQQVFEEAAVDLGKGLRAWSDSRSGKRKGNGVGFPRFKKKTGAAPSFRLRNKHRPRAVGGDPGRRQRSPRSVTLPGIGPIAVHDDTRRLRRHARQRPGENPVRHRHPSRRALVGFAERRGRRPAPRPPVTRPAPTADDGGWVGVDRGLSAFLVAATTDGRGVARIGDAPKALRRRDETSTATGEVVVTQAERITQPP